MVYGENTLSVETGTHLSLLLWVMFTVAWGLGEREGDEWMNGLGREGDLASGYTSVKHWTSKAEPQHKPHITFSANLIYMEKTKSTWQTWR